MTEPRIASKRCMELYKHSERPKSTTPVSTEQIDWTFVYALLAQRNAHFLKLSYIK